MTFRDKFITWINNSYSSKAVIALASLSYIIQSWIYSQNQESFLDEGYYLLKGYLFASGKYSPFQEFGTWTNKMPLSFLIPGYVQKYFGPGLYTGRIFVFILAVLILVGMLIIGYRLGGKLGGVLAAVLLAINPAVLKIYNMVLSEVLIVFLLVASFVLIIGNNRQLWQILLGSFLIGIIPVTRINLLPVLPLMIIYIFWENGYNKGFYGLLASMVPFIGVNLAFWPEILQLWAKWIPEGLSQFIDGWRKNLIDTVGLHDNQRTIVQRFLAFIEGIRYHFPALMGIFTSWCLWPKKWPNRSNQRLAIFLSALFSVLFIAHFWASILQNSNIFAFSVYVSYFEFIGILILIITIADWNYELGLISRMLIVIGIASVSFGIAYSVSTESNIYGQVVKGLLLKKRVWFQDGGFVLGPGKWWEVLSSKFGWEFSTTLKIIGIVLFIIIVLALLGVLTYFLNFHVISKNGSKKNQYLPQVLVIFLGLGILFTPTDILGGGKHNYDCQIGVIKTYDTAVDEISPYVNRGSHVFWIGSGTQPVLLGLIEKRGIEIFPQQLNSQYSFRFGGDVDQLARWGFWNTELAQEWINISDILLLENQALTGWFEPVYSLVDLADFEKVGETSMIGCDERQRLFIYRKSQ